jgi:hypothetical protein
MEARDTSTSCPDLDEQPCPVERVGLFDCDACATAWACVTREIDGAEVHRYEVSAENCDCIDAQGQRVFDDGDCARPHEEG